MTKLFSLESSDDSQDLLIDKVIKKAQKDKEGLSVTADLIKQRQKLKVQIDEELKKSEPAEGASDDADSEDTDSSSDNSGDTGGDPSGGDGDNDNSSSDADAKPEESSEDSKTDEGDAGKPQESKDKDEEEDPSEQAQDMDKLESMVGSSLGGKKDSKEEPKEEKESVKDEKKDDGGKVAKESYRGDSIIPTKLFQGLKSSHSRYCIAVEEYNLKPAVNDPKDQPIAYVKEEVVDSLKKMIELSNRYISKNQKLTESSAKGVLKLSESLTVYQECHKAEKLHLNLKVSSSEEVLRSVCTPDSSDLKEVSKILDRFLEGNATLVAKVLGNPIEEIESAVKSTGYKLEEGVYGYCKTLPGFNAIRLTFSHYEDYIKTKYEDYQAYRVKVMKVQELHELPGVSINKDGELVAIMETCSKIVTQVGMMLDNLKDLGNEYSGLMEKVKATCFDVEQGKVNKLAELDIDTHLKDFIRFKLASELCAMAVELGIEFVTGVMTVFSELIELDQ